MRRILLAALCSALLVGVSTGVASARLGVDDQASAPSAPMSVPIALPEPDREHPFVYGYRSSAAIAAELVNDAPASAGGSATPGVASATVTVTATVLPTVTLVLGDEGELESIVVNTDDRDPGSVVFQVREGSRAVALDSGTWASARAALARARAGTGTVWTRDA